MELREKLDPKHTALLVIDIQNDFAAPDGLFAKRGRDMSMVEPMLKRLQKTIEAASKACVPIFFTQQIYDRSKLSELQKEQYDLDGKYITCDVATDGYKFYKINPPPESVFVKHDYNAFSNPNLEKALNTRGTKTLVITGMDTYWCVETAIRNAFDLGYKIVVPEDLVACNGRHLELHNRTLELTRKTFGIVIDSEELNAIWGG
ncbi:MAG: cysteine hydrolase family protein [Patescibacteria group bacterium]|nr:cysteine hydrolase family protein [Patescibacteria group bacterium]